MSCLLPTAYCLLPTAYCLLPTAYCLTPPRLQIAKQRIEIAVVAPEHAGELVAQLQRQPHSLDVDIADLAPLHPPVDIGRLAGGELDLAAHHAVAHAGGDEALAGKALGVAGEGVRHEIEREPHIALPVARRQLAAIATEREHRHPLIGAVALQQRAEARRCPPERAAASASLATWVTSWRSSASAVAGASSRAAGSACARAKRPRRLIGRDRESITTFPCPC